MAGRRIVDSSGRRLPVNEDGTVVRRAVHEAIITGGSGGLPSLIYYPLKLVFLLVCVAEGLAGGMLLSYFSDALFGVDFGLKGIITAFFPLVSVIVAIGSGGVFVVRHVDKDAWTRIFLAPLVELLFYAIAVGVLWLFALSMATWWSVLIFIVVAGVALSAVGGRNDD